MLSCDKIEPGNDDKWQKKSVIKITPEEKKRF